MNRLSEEIKEAQAIRYERVAFNQSSEVLDKQRLVSCSSRFCSDAHRKRGISLSSRLLVCIESTSTSDLQGFTAAPLLLISLYSVLFFFIPFIILALLSRSLPVVSQIRGHIAGPPPLSPLRYVPSFLSREEVSIFFPRRLASNCTYTWYRVLPTRNAKHVQTLEGTRQEAIEDHNFMQKSTSSGILNPFSESNEGKRVPGGGAGATPVTAARTEDGNKKLSDPKTRTKKECACRESLGTTGIK